MVNIKDDETLDDLSKADKKIIQKKNGFRFAVDAVLLANFVTIKKAGKLIDFGTGTGIMPILLSEHKKIEKIYGIEIQEEIAEMAKRSIEINKLNEKIEILNTDIEGIYTKLGDDFAEYVISNPPYIKIEEGITSLVDTKAISRHEVKIKLDRIVYNARRILKTGGRFCIIYRVYRFQELITTLSEHKFNIKRIRFVYTKEGDEASFVMIEAIKNSRCEIEIMPPMNICDANGNNTEEFLSYY